MRIALGAQRRGILSMVLREGVMLGSLGALCGALLGYAAGRTMQAPLAGAGPADSTTLAVAIGLSLAVTIAGSLVPAVRAARVDPNARLRGG